MCWNLIVNGDYDQHQQLSKPSPAPIRPSNVFHGNPAYPTPPNPYAASMPPQLPNGIDHLPTHTAVSTSTAVDAKREDRSHSPDAKPEPAVGKPSRKPGKLTFFGLEDPEKSGHKVRVKMALHECPMQEVPDSYRKKNTVYPRRWFAESKEEPEVGTLLVNVPMLEGEGELKVPALDRRARRKEEQLNDMGYRISWGQRWMFNDRVLFLQQSIDMYRGKMRDAMVAGGQEAESVAPLYETRRGKKRWVEGRGRGKGKGARG